MPTRARCEGGAPALVGGHLEPSPDSCAGICPHTTLPFLAPPLMAVCTALHLAPAGLWPRTQVLQAWRGRRPAAQGEGPCLHVGCARAACHAWLCLGCPAPRLRVSALHLTLLRHALPHSPLKNPPAHAPVCRCMSTWASLRRPRACSWPPATTTSERTQQGPATGAAQQAGRLGWARQPSSRGLEAGSKQGRLALLHWPWLHMY